MIESLQELAIDWIDCKKHVPPKDGYYEATTCDDPENVIKYEIIAYESMAWMTIGTIFEKQKLILNIKYWRNICK